MSWLRPIAATRWTAGFALAAALGCGCQRADATAGDVCELQLRCSSTRRQTRLIGSFTMAAGQKIAARRAELEEIGLKPSGSASPDDVMALDEVVGLSYRYDEASQKIFITVSDELRARKTLNGSAMAKQDIAVRSDFGGVLNYTLFSGGTGQWAPRLFGFDGSSATFDARAFSPFGTLSQSGILRTGFANRFDALRLDTTFAYSDRETLTTYRLGDAINGGLAWTRPIRMGGFSCNATSGCAPTS